MTLRWIHDSPTWDDDKAAIVGGAEAGIFDRRYGALSPGDLPPGDWWRVEEDGRTVGYGWMDLVWGDAEILLATRPGERGRGIGSFILQHLEDEARERGLNYVYNVVRPSHPDRATVTAWLEKRGFRASEDGSLLRSVVKPRGHAPPTNR